MAERALPGEVQSRLLNSSRSVRPARERLAAGLWRAHNNLRTCAGKRQEIAKSCNRAVPREYYRPGNWTRGWQRQPNSIAGRVGRRRAPVVNALEASYHQYETPRAIQEACASSEARAAGFVALSLCVRHGLMFPDERCWTGAAAYRRPVAARSRSNQPIAAANGSLKRSSRGGSSRATAGTGVCQSACCRQSPGSGCKTHR